VAATWPEIRCRPLRWAFHRWFVPLPRGLYHSRGGVIAWAPACCPSLRRSHRWVAYTVPPWSSPWSRGLVRPRRDVGGCLRPGVHLRIAGPRDKHPCCAVGSLWSDWRPLGVVQYSKVIFAIQIFAQYSCITVCIPVW